jgi:hypothetical protein
MTEPVPARMLWLVTGFTVWATAFIALYTIQAVGCAFEWPFAVHRGVLGAVLAAHLAVIAWLIAKAPRDPGREFLSTVAVFTLWAALVSTVVTYGPALLLRACL